MHRRLFPRNGAPLIAVALSLATLTDGATAGPPKPATTPAPDAANLADLTRQVRDAESAFARSMAERDTVAFAAALAPEAIFFGRAALRGSTAVMAGWRRFFQGEKAPFSWAPETVEVLDSGTLALTSGPVKNPDGEVVGTFNSIWRREPDGRWRVVFDKGCPVCAPEGK